MLHGKKESFMYYERQCPVCCKVLTWTECVTKEIQKIIIHHSKQKKPERI